MTSRPQKPPIDVHILHMENEINLLGNPVHPLINVHHGEGIVNNTFQARVNGFSMGTAPYISFLDIDDEVDLEAFETCYDFLENNPEYGGVYTNSTLVDEIKGTTRMLYSPHVWSPQYHTTRPVPIHSLVVMRRSVYEQALPTVDRSVWINDLLAMHEQMLYTYIAAIKPWYFININAYTWYKREGGGHSRSTGANQLWVQNFKKSLLLGK